jgi:hypothetical protein
MVRLEDESGVVGGTDFTEDYGVRGQYYANTVGALGYRLGGSAGSIGPYGVYGKSSHIGVLGESTSSTNPGIRAQNYAGGPALEIAEGAIKIDSGGANANDGNSYTVTINKPVGSVTNNGGSSHWVTVNNSYVKSGAVIITGASILNINYSAHTFQIYVTVGRTVGFLIIN